VNIQQKTGMQGVYLVAAELTYKGFIVSVTSRSAFGADLLATDQSCKKAWSVQVKTNKQAATFWLLNKHAKELISDSHVYVFVNLKGNERPEYHVVRSEEVANAVCVETTPSGVWYSFDRRSLANPKAERWEIFENPKGEPESEPDPSAGATD